MYLTEEKFDKSMALRDERFDRIMALRDEKFDKTIALFNNKFDRAMAGIAQHFDRIDKRFQKLEDEIAGIYVVIREVGEELTVRFNDDMHRYIGSLTEEYQERLKIAGEGNQLTSEKCDRRYAKTEEKDRRLSKQISKLEAHILRK